MKTLDVMKMTIRSSARYQSHAAPLGISSGPHPRNWTRVIGPMLLIMGRRTNMTDNEHKDENTIMLIITSK